MGVRALGMGVKRFEVYLVTLDLTLGSEIQKTRPCVVISPDEMNSLTTDNKLKIHTQTIKYDQKS